MKSIDKELTYYVSLTEYNEVKRMFLKANYEINTLKDKIERLEKQLNIAIGVLSQYAEAPTRNLARCALDRIAEIGGDYSHYWEQQIKELGNA